MVAADDPDIVKEVERFGGNVVMTDPQHRCGTDRVAEVARDHDQFEIFVNVQGDEPDLPGDAINLAISILETKPDAQMATLATPIRNEELLRDPSCVKVVLNAKSQAIYFSRAAIPFARQWHHDLLTADPPNFFQHVGLYAYRRQFLLQIPAMNRPAIEATESLEQLRVLHAGIPIHVGVIDHPIVGIDTPHDYAAFVRRQVKR